MSLIENLQNKCAIIRTAFDGLNKLGKVSIGLIIAHWVLMRLVNYFCIIPIRTDSISHWLIDTVASITRHPITMMHPVCVGGVHYMMKASEMFISVWYIAATGMLATIMKYVGGGYERIIESKNEGDVPDKTIKETMPVFSRPSVEITHRGTALAGFADSGSVEVNGRKQPVN